MKGSKMSICVNGKPQFFTNDIFKVCEVITKLKTKYPIELSDGCVNIKAEDENEVNAALRQNKEGSGYETRSNLS